MSLLDIPSLPDWCKGKARTVIKTAETRAERKKRLAKIRKQRYRKRHPEKRWNGISRLRTWVRENKKKANSARKKWMKKHPENVREAARRWRAKNPELKRAQNRRYYERKKAQFLASSSSNTPNVPVGVEIGT